MRSFLMPQCRSRARLIIVAAAILSETMSALPQHVAQDAEAGKHTNRLGKETSPYLLQHAHNPVDWYPWGPEAFAAARQQNKLIFLSIGYSTCYWCHVMERESFENNEIAAVMNQHFISIKVDREERPDVDEIYMTATQLLTGSGGWPMSVFLEPTSLKPVIAGTYFPPEDRHGMPSFRRVLMQMADAWQDRRDALLEQAQQVASAVTAHLSNSAQVVPIGKADVDRAVALLMSSFDRADGGFGGGGRRDLGAGGPKFPTPVYLDFLMSAAWNDKTARDAALFTLDRMAIGGMYDQIGGGFHRYSTDGKWLVPHFEKMLYDNAQLASTYARAFELAKDSFHAEIVRKTLDYVLREMTHAAGGFYSAQDAEVDGHEGANYLWNEQDMREALLGGGLKDDVDFALNIYGLRKGANFRDPHHPQDEPKNVLYLSDRPALLIKSLGVTAEQFYMRMNRINAALLAARAKRLQPGLDDKILAGWNGLMIAGLADGGRVLNEQMYKDAAAKAAQFVLANMRDASTGRLMRSFRDGQPKIDAFLEDYAFLIRGLIALHRATNDRKTLEDARRLAQVARTTFWDSSGGGFFDTREGQSDLFVRVKSINDSAVPSGNSVMLHNLLDLHELTGHVAYLDDATATLKSMSGAVSRNPTSCILAVAALKRFVDNYPRRLDQQAPASATGDGATSHTGPVQVTVNPKEIQVKPGSPGRFEITFVISKRYHVNAHEPGDEFLVPLEVNLTGCEGLKLIAEYPKGQAYKTEFAEGAIYVHHGALVLPVRVEQIGKFSGQPRLTLTYQTCTDKECLEPVTQVIGVRILAER